MATEKKDTVYKVFIEPKADSNKVAAQTCILLAAQGYKEAWVAARLLCRVGGEIKMAEPQGETDVGTLSAGTHTVRKVFSTAGRGRQKAPDPITVEQLLAVAKEREIPVSRKLHDLATELLGYDPLETEQDSAAAA
jgi:hypothetical protein